MIACFDCGLPYKSPRFADFVVPDDVWSRISPTHDEAGILCAGCILLRLTVLGIECEGRFTSGPCAQHDWVKPRAALETRTEPVVNVETIWNCASREQQSSWAEAAGLLRVSSFARTLPPWSQLPEDWRPKLVPHVRTAANR